MLALLQKAIYYTFSIGTEALIAAALLPILTARLVPADYGVWVLLIAYVSFFRPLLHLMLPDALRMKYFQYATKDIQGIITIGLLLPTAFATAIVFANLLSQNFLANSIGLSGRELALVLVFAVLHGFYYLVLALLQFKEKPRLFLAQQIIQTIITIGLTLILLQYEASWTAPLLARITALIINSLLGLLWIRSVYHHFWDIDSARRLSKNVISTGLRLLPAGLAVVIVPLSDRMLVTKLIGVQETSFLGIGALFSLVVSIFVSGLIHAWQPILYKQINNVESADNIDWYSRLFFIAIPVLGLILAFVGVTIAPLMMSYDLALIKPYIIVFSLVAVIDGYYQHNYIILKGLQKTNLLAILSVILIVSNIGFDLLLIPLHGGIGSAWGTVLAYVLITILSGYFLLKFKRQKKH